MAWYIIDDPKDPELDALALKFNLDPLYIEDCRSNKERTKVEGTDQYLFMILRYIPSLGNESIEPASIYLFAGRDFLITVRDNPSAPNDVLARARNAGAQEKPAKLLYIIVDTLVDSYFPSLDRSDDRIDELEDLVLENPTPKILEKLFSEKRILISMRRLLVNLRDVCMSLQRDFSAILGSDLYPYFRDVYDHVLRLVDSVDVSRDLLDNTLDVYLSSVANRTNQVMKVLTVLSTVALPALVISGIYGMNLKGLPFINSAYGTMAVIGSMVVCTGILLWMLKRFGWL